MVLSSLLIPLAILSATMFAIATSSELMAYTNEQMLEIRQQEKQKWDSVAVNPSTTKMYHCLVLTSAVFLIEPPSVNVRMKIKGRVFIIDERGDITGQQFLSPMDNSKIYIYNPKGLIVKSAQFYEGFALEWEAKANETFKIIMQDGPPGPPKLISWEIDMGGYEESRHLPEHPFSINDMDQIKERLHNLSSELTAIKQQEYLTTLSQTNQQLTFERDNETYKAYLMCEGATVLFIVFLQVRILKRMLQSQGNFVI